MIRIIDLGIIVMNGGQLKHPRDWKKNQSTLESDILQKLIRKWQSTVSQMPINPSCIAYVLENRGFRFFTFIVKVKRFSNYLMVSSYTNAMIAHILSYERLL